MKRHGMALALTGLTALSACSGVADGDEQLGSSSDAVLGVDTFLYLRCNTTGWNPDDSTRMVETEPGVFSITFEVSEGWMIDSNDVCQLTETNQLNGWGSLQIGRHTGGVTLAPPSSASTVVGFQPVVFDYSALGAYTVSFDANTQTLSIAEAEITVEGDWLWPLDGVAGVDWIINNYVDVLYQSFGRQDYTGGQRTYAGHLGIDIDIATFRSQDAGVPVRAVKGGQVIDLREDQFDRNTSCTGDWNFVHVRTADETDIFYGHLKTDSVVVNVGDVVEPGDVLGLVGSSGCSTQPHLHLEAYDRFGVLVDPFRDGLWSDPPAYAVPLGVMDIIVTGDPEMSWLDPDPNLTTLGAPFQLITAASLGGGFGGDNFVIRVLRPDGSVFGEADFGQYTDPFGHNFLGQFWDLSQDAVPGTWQIEFLVNGELRREHDVQLVP